MSGRYKDIDRHVTSRAADRFVERPEGQHDGVIQKANRKAPRDDVIRRAWNWRTRCALSLDSFYRRFMGEMFGINNHLFFFVNN